MSYIVNIRRNRNVNEIVMKIIKGLVLAAIFGGVTYLLLKSLTPALLMAAVMFATRAMYT